MRTLEATSLATQEREALKQYLEALERELGDRLEAVWLYGSRARGEPRAPDSDVDLLVITRDGAWDDQLTATHLATAFYDWEPPVFLSPRVATRRLLDERRAIDSFYMREVDRDRIVLRGAA